MTARIAQYRIRTHSSTISLFSQQSHYWYSVVSSVCDVMYCG